MAGRPDVDRMLSEIPAKLVNEWKAYESVNGRLDRTWEQHALSMIDVRLQQALQVQLAANSKKGKTKYKVTPLELPWEHEKAEADRNKPKLPARSGPKHEASKKDFYASLAARAKKRRISQESIVAQIAERRKAGTLDTPSKQPGGARWQ